MLTDLILDNKLGRNSDDRIWLEDRSESLIENKKQIAKEYDSGFDKLPKKPMLIVARRWNSWTPAMPTDGHGKGGGYFFSDGDRKIVIDPGFGFLKILYHSYEICVSDIDAIVITHDHPDHWADLGTILAMRFTRKDECQPLKIFMNPSSYLMHEKYIRYYSSLLHGEKPIFVKPGSDITIDNIVIKTVATEHDEIAKYADAEIQSELLEKGGTGTLGLKITNSDEDAKYTFSILGDSAFPKDQNILRKLTSFFDNSDVLVLHLGSIEEGWCKEKKSPASSIVYSKDRKKHLGISGCVRFSKILNSQLIIITEFGKELKLKNGRTSTVSMIKELSGCRHVLPADIGLCIVKDKNDLYCRCSKCKEFIPVKHVICSEDNEDLRYITQAGCGSGREHKSL